MDRLKLRVTEGNATGTEIDVDDELLIGRSTEGDGRLGEDIEISRRHARIARTSDGTYEIEDLGSTNGTVVNGRVIEMAEELIPGDTIGVGATRLVVQVTELGPPVEAEAYPYSEPVVSVPGPEAAEEPVEDEEPLAEEEPLADEEPLAQEEEPLAEEVPLPEDEATQYAPPPLPRLSLRLDVDFETGEAEISLDEESDTVRLVLDDDGRWRLP